MLHNLIEHTRIITLTGVYTVISTAVILGLMLGGLIITAPLTSEAGGAGYQLDTTGLRTEDIVQNTNNLTQDIHFRATQGDRMAHEQSQRALRGVVDNMVDFVNTGMDGDPAFVQNIPQFLQGRVDQRVQNFIDQLGSRMDTPFLADIQNALQQVHTQNMRGEIPGYNASQVDIQAFLGGDFAQGGWGGFAQIINDPSANTPLGAHLTAEQEMSRFTQGVTEEELTKLNWGDGFRSIEQCGPSGQNCQITTPGNVVADQLNRALGTSFDSLVAANQMDQTVEDTFARLSQEALAGANGLLGISLNAGEIFSAILSQILDEDASDEEVEEAMGIADEFIVEVLENASEEEEQYLAFIEDILADDSVQLADNQETDLLERANQSQLNLVELNDLLIRIEEVGDVAAEDFTQDETTLMREIYDDYRTLRRDLHNQADIALIRSELEL